MMSVKTFVHVLVVLVIFTSPSLGLYRNPDCPHRAGYFTISYRDRTLINHVIKHQRVLDELECGRACLANDMCQSYNYGTTVDRGGKHVCELNDDTAGASPNDVIDREGFLYYEGKDDIQSHIGCSANQCLNGGTCVTTCAGDMFKCHCPPYLGGKYCEQATARDCQGIKSMGGLATGIYPISLGGQGMKYAICDQATDGGGWIVIQHRQAPFTTNFSRSWKSYMEGFGNLNGEFWLGNEVIHQLTKTPKSLRIQLLSSRNSGYGLFRRFSISSNSDGYRLSLGIYNTGGIGNAFDDTLNPAGTQIGWRFSTRDKDNDNNNFLDCADMAMSGWWYNSCGHSDLNRKDIPLWDTWHAYTLMTNCTMKIR